ncbi:hypothetical protein HYX09_04610 [Candidatus Woesearchaeota archaeon]|nr:hypothetical protein [Candidatus Woesearchaeota archaeon]
MITPIHSGTAMPGVNLSQKIECEICGAEMTERHCKLVCQNCGFMWDCSDH